LLAWGLHSRDTQRLALGRDGFVGKQGEMWDCLHACPTPITTHLFATVVLVGVLASVYEIISCCVLLLMRRLPPDELTGSAGAPTARWLATRWVGGLSMAIAAGAMLLQERYLSTHWSHKHSELCRWVECNPIILKDWTQMWSIVGAVICGIYFVQGWRSIRPRTQFDSVLVVANGLALLLAWCLYT
jgi:hypothetical protein